MRAGQRLLWFAVALVVLQVLVAGFAEWVAPYDPVAQDIMARMKGPTAAHWLGTDQFGRALLAEAVARGVCSLECFRANGPARRFYERAGWVVTRGYSRPFAGRLHGFVYYERNEA